MGRRQPRNLWGGVQNTETGAHTDGLRTTVVSGPTAVQGGLPAERCAVVDNLASGTGERDETPGNSARNGQLDSMHAGDVYTDSVPRHEGTAALTDANGSSTVGASTVTAIVQGLDEDGANNRGGGVGVSTIPGGAEGDGVDASLNVSAMPHGNSDTHVEGKVVKAAKRINRRANLKKLPATMPPSYPEDKSNRSDGKPSSRTSVTNITTNDGNSARARGEGPAQRSLTYSHTSNAAEDSDTAFAQMLDAEINGRRTRRSRVPVTHNEKTSTVVGVGEKSRSAEGSAAGETTAAGEETATNAEGSTNREPAVKRTAATREKAAKRAVAIPRPGKVGKNVASATVESSANSVMAADECEKLERGMSTWVNTGMDTETDAGIRQLIETHTGTHGVLQDSKDVRNKANDRSEPIEVDAVVRMDSEGETVHDRTDALQVDEGPGETNHSQPHTPGNMTIDGKTDSHEYAGMGAVAGRMGGKTNNADPDLPQKGQVLTIPGDATGKARSQKHGRDTNNRNYNPHRQHWAYATYLPKATSTASEGEPSSENRSGRHGNGEPVGVLSKNTQTDRVIETPDVGTITAALNGTLNNTLARTSTTSILGLVAVDSLPTSKHTIANATNAPELESAQSSLRVSQPLSSPTPDYQAQGQYHRDQYQAQVKACTSRSKRARSAAGADEPALVLQNRRWSTRAKKPVEYQEPHIYDIGGVYAAGQPRSHNPPTKVVPEGTLELEKELEGRALVALTASDSESDYGDNSDEEDISVPETAVRPEGSLVPLVVEKHMSKLKAEPESGTGKSITGAGGGGKGKGAAGSGTQPQKKKKLLPKQINFILPIPPVTGHKSVTYGGRQEASTANKSGRNNPGRQTKTEKLIENTNYSADVALEVVRTINKRVLALDNNRGAGPSSAIALEIAAQVANEDLVAERNVVRQKKGKVAPPPGEKPYACRVEGCGKTFRYSQNLNAHRAVHTGVYPYPCTWGSCEHKFVSQRDLSRHTRSSHTFERPFKCPEPECGKCFPRADTLTIHQRTHTGEKPYICSWGGCNRACGTQRELVRHVRTHTGEKPFECPVEGCTRRFADASGRNQHERAHNKPYKCPYGQECDKSFASRAGLVQHLLMQHGLVVGVVTNVNN
ncbi:hypothetical protein SARC_10899 [Sphaeroforma arctica JP610]|uniref:C2H2-type domain-containing protein n=1 Tax=Sphaeroforma arctica JP610 TaxID=667725 RepID=A0A0L0FIL3_9EUKA|nr:hypothetical protein SARC_10899 [Sphaeroforma arctica JP610]KNC76609.1 hypothetical protein SARC_10899 [Sphaeroforma arctica JP610]|eukprot:XP_014150511.1 hypothetical protein SARC_10899 [Sphaeroforma arctica JP610]